MKYWNAANYCNNHDCKNCIIYKEFTEQDIDKIDCFHLLLSLDKFYNIKYVVDNGAKWEKRICVIRALDKESALDIFHKTIESKLQGEEFVVDGYTKVIECADSPVLLDTVTIDNESELYYG